MTDQTNPYQDLIPPQHTQPVTWSDAPNALLVLAFVVAGLLVVRYRRHIAAAMSALLRSWVVYPFVGLVFFGFARELGHFYGARDSVASALVFVTCMAVTSIPMAAKLFRRP